jgi:hypothetical protein
MNQSLRGKNQATNYISRNTICKLDMQNIFCVLLGHTGTETRNVHIRVYAFLKCLIFIIIIIIILCMLYYYTKIVSALMTMLPKWSSLNF